MLLSSVIIAAVAATAIAVYNIIINKRFDEMQDEYEKEKEKACNKCSDKEEEDLFSDEAYKEDVDGNKEKDSSKYISIN